MSRFIVIARDIWTCYLKFEIVLLGFSENDFSIELLVRLRSSNALSNYHKENAWGCLDVPFYVVLAKCLNL